MSSTQDAILLNTFLDAAGGEWGGVALDDLLALLAAAMEERAAATATTSSSSRSTSSAGQQDSGSSGVSKVLSTALKMVPVAGALLSIFGGDDAKTPEPLVRYALPPALRFEAANSAAGVTSVDYGQEGLPRLATRKANAAVETFEAAFEEPGATVRQFGDESSLASGDSRSETGYAGRVRNSAASQPAYEERTQTAAAREPAQVTIQVQAMDSRSFLDHSAEIAQAVREAMLNMHALNDVVSDI